MRNAPETVFSAVSAASNQLSDAIPATQLISMSLQAVLSGATGTIDGAVKIQFSNDNPKNGAPVSWSDISSATVTISSNAVFAIGKTDLAYQWVRVNYVKNSVSDGLLTVKVNLMGL